MADNLILQFGYFGIFLVLVLGGLGLPVPEEAPIILAAILARKGTMGLVPALASCFAGVLVGDFVVYFLGYFYGEKVLRFPLTRKFLTKAREEQIKGYFHRHGVKILIIGRFAVGFRTAAYLTAGILRLPTLKLFLTDLCAASFSTLLVFGLSYKFASQVEEGFKEAKHYVTPIIALVLVVWLLHHYLKARTRAGKAVGPPVLVEEIAPLMLERNPNERPDQSRPKPAEMVSLDRADHSEEIPEIVPEIGPVPLLPTSFNPPDPSSSHHPALSPEIRP